MSDRIGTLVTLKEPILQVRVVEVQGTSIYVAARNHMVGWISGNDIKGICELAQNETTKDD